MKHLFILLFFILSITAFSQKTIPGSFIIKDNKSTYSETFITNSINASNLEAYRLREKSNTIVFDNGFTVELLSAKELVMKGLITEPSGYIDAFPANVHKHIFSLLNTGLVTIGIIESVHPKSSKK